MEAGHKVPRFLFAFMVDGRDHIHCHLLLGVLDLVPSPQLCLEISLPKAPCILWTA
jgi:hypothetical protein